MTSIYDLPHELVAAIGDHLAPKWRCRLFITCKVWYYNCYVIVKDIFDTCKRKVTINSDINKIQYIIVDSRMGGHISEIVKPNKNNPTYASTGYYYRNIYCEGMFTTIINDCREYRILDNMSIVIDYSGNYKYYSIQKEYKRHRVNFDVLCIIDDGTYNIYESLQHLRNYVSKNDMFNFAIALGKRFTNVYLDKCISWKIFDFTNELT